MMLHRTIQVKWHFVMSAIHKGDVYGLSFTDYAMGTIHGFRPAGGSVCQG